jgi:Na+/H+ antiporter NhaC
MEYLIIFLLFWWIAGFIAAGYVFAYFTKKYTILYSNKISRGRTFKSDKLEFLIATFIFGLFGLIAVVNTEYAKKGWMFPWSKKTLDYLGLTKEDLK